MSGIAEGYDRCIEGFEREFFRDMHQLYQFFTDFLSPPACVQCGLFLSQRNLLCAVCVKQIKPIVSTQLRLTKTKQLTVLAATGYHDPLKSLILGKGYGNKLAAQQLGEFIWQFSYVQHLQFDIIVPVPLHWTRYAYRGFNQAHEIAQVLARKSGKPCVALIKRTRRTVQQSTLSSDAREKNVKSVFQITKTPQSMRGKRILLVDDLITTGATLRSAAKVLYQLKPTAVQAVVACRVVRS